MSIPREMGSGGGSQWKLSINIDKKIDKSIEKVAKIDQKSDRKTDRKVGFLASLWE